MSMVAKVVSVMESVLGPVVEEFVEQRNLIQRKRKFCGQTLLQMLVFSLLKKPDATFADMAFTAAQLGVNVSAMAVEKRFTQPLVDFLEGCPEPGCSADGGRRTGFRGPVGPFHRRFHW